MVAELAGDLREAHRELTTMVMGRKGVTGTGIGKIDGRPCLKVYVRAAGAGPSLPERVGGFRVIVEATGGLKRL